jgi:hypothetical protein
MSKTNEWLPVELWNELFESMRGPEREVHGMVIYRGERKVGIDEKLLRYETLLSLSLSSKYLRPIAQRELLSRIHIQSEKSLLKLVEALEGSRELQEIAKAAKSIFFDGRWIEAISDGMIARLARYCINVKDILVSDEMSLSLSDISRLSLLV